LISFNNKVKVECEITPYYELFRDHVNSLDTSGGTALYEALEEASKKLLSWKKEKKSEAKLRIICLSDGIDTEGKKSSLINSDINLDCIFIGNEYDRSLISLSDYIFNPKSIKDALDIFELETMIS